MQYFASLRVRGMPNVPIPHITSDNADIPNSSTSGGVQATHLPSRRLSPCASMRQRLATNRGLSSGAGDCLIGHFGNANFAALRHNEALQNTEGYVIELPELMPCLPKSANLFEHDLAAMVQDYMENGSHGSKFYENRRDEERSDLADSKPHEALQVLISNKTVFEKELLSVITAITLSLNNKDLPCVADASRNCRGRCIRRVLVKHLQLMKYDAAVCSSKWPSAGKMPCGEYEYIDVIFDNGSGKSDRVIVDLDFQSQFKIARPTQPYLAALSSLPVVFIGSVEKLCQAVQVLAGAAKASLKQNCMPLPPWRTLAYMKAKWVSPSKRLDAKAAADESLDSYGKGYEYTRPKGQCIQELEFLKVSMSSGVFVQET